MSAADAHAIPFCTLHRARASTAPLGSLNASNTLPSGDLLTCSSGMPRVPGNVMSAESISSVSLPRLLHEGPIRLQHTGEWSYLGKREGGAVRRGGRAGGPIPTGRISAYQLGPQITRICSFGPGSIDLRPNQWHA